MTFNLVDISKFMFRYHPHPFLAFIVFGCHCCVHCCAYTWMCMCCVCPCTRITSNSLLHFLLLTAVSPCPHTLICSAFHYKSKLEVLQRNKQLIVSTQYFSQSRVAVCTLLPGRRIWIACIPSGRQNNKPQEISPSRLRLRRRPPASPANWREKKNKTNS